MILKLDAVAKTIQIDGTVNASELFKALKAMLPDGLWKEFNIFQKPTEYIYNPIYPVTPYVSPYIWYPSSPVVTLPWINYTAANNYKSVLDIKAASDVCNSNYVVGVDAAIVGNDTTVKVLGKSILNEGVFEVVLMTENETK